jgi:hypothetical protein
LKIEVFLSINGTMKAATTHIGLLLCTCCCWRVAKLAAGLGALISDIAGAIAGAAVDSQLLVSC